MQTVEQNLELLIESVKNTQEYQNYLRAKEQIDQDAELKRRVDEYRAKNFKIQNNAGNEELYRSLDERDIEAREFRKNPLIDEFLTMELALCRMVQRINWKLIGALDFDVDFIED